MSKERANYSEDRKVKENEKSAQRKTNERANYSEEKKEEEKEKLADRMAKVRKAKSEKVPETYRAACHNTDIMLGNIIVPPLEETEDAIGPMNVICPHCGARKFKGEPPSICCNNGKIKLGLLH